MESAIPLRIRMITEYYLYMFLMLILAAKFCTDCRTTVISLLKTKAFITVTSWLRSKTCLTRLICAGLDTQDEVVFKTWSSKVSCGVWNNTRSLAEYARVRSFESINGQTQEPSESWLCPFHITGNFKLVMNKVQGQKFAEGHYYLIIEKFSGKKW